LMNEILKSWDVTLTSNDSPLARDVVNSGNKWKKILRFILSFELVDISILNLRCIIWNTLDVK